MSVVTGAMALIGLPAAASATTAGPTSCTSTLGAGAYLSVSVSPGAMREITGAVTVLTGFRVGAGAAALVDPTASLVTGGSLTVGTGGILAVPQNSSPVDIHGSVSVGTNAVFLLGTETPGGPIVNHIGGSVNGSERERGADPQRPDRGVGDPPGRRRGQPRGRCPRRRISAELQRSRGQPGRRVANAICSGNSPAVIRADVRGRPTP